MELGKPLSVKRALPSHQRHSHICCAFCQPDPRFPLYNYHEIPIFLQENPYVVRGYRVRLPCKSCLRSLFYWNNESINVWSHLLGFLLFAFLFVSDNVSTLPAMDASLYDHLVISCMLVCYQICMIFSASYHLFFCQSEEAARRWFAADLAGISVGLIGCYLPGIYYAFYCQWLWRDVYVFILAVLFANVLYWQTKPHYYTKSWHHVRWLLYAALSAFGLLPTAHWVYLNGGISAELTVLFLHKVIVMYLLLAAAFTFYISKWPERSCPGSFDYVGCSHQWWHLVILFSFYWWHSAGLQLMRYYRLHSCHG